MLVRLLENLTLALGIRIFIANYPYIFFGEGVYQMHSKKEFSKAKFSFMLFIISLFISSCSQPPTNTLSFPELEPISVGNFHKLEGITRLGRGEIHEIALSPDGKTLAISSPTGIYFYDTETNENFLTLEEKNLGALAFSYDGSLIAVASKRINTSIRIMRLADNSLTTIMQLFEVPIAHEVFEMKFSQDGQQLYVHSGYGVTASAKCGGPEFSYALHDLSTASANNTLLVNNILFETHSCHFSENTTRFTRDGKLLLNLPGGGHYHSFLLDASTGRIIHEGEGYNSRDGKNIFDISPNGSVLAIYSENDNPVPIKLVDSENGNILSTVQEKLLFFNDDSRQVRHLYLPDESIDELGVWENEDLICTMDIEHYQAVDPTHSYLLTISNWHFNIWNIAQCTISAQINYDFSHSFIAGSTKRAFSSDGGYLALFSRFSYENLRIWDFNLDNAYEIHKVLPEEISTLPDSVSMAFIPSTYILVVTTDTDTIFFDVEQWRIVDIEEDISNLDFLHDSEIISIDGKLRIRSLRNKNRILFLEAENNAYLDELEPKFQFTDIIFSPDGRLLVFVSGDGTLHVWGVQKE